MKKKSDCGFRYKGIILQECMSHDGIHPDIVYENDYYSCQITQVECIGLKKCPIINK
jgi:hypothetical protein